jgi:ferredoxin-thioredoxin reductase catalytic chain
MPTQTVDQYRKVLAAFAASKGLAINPDTELVRSLAEGLLRNKDQHGYASCPCCFATGDREKDADIICPCAASKIDLPRDGICRCGLYVTPDTLARVNAPHEPSCPQEE